MWQPWHPQSTKKYVDAGTSFDGDPGKTKQAFKAECDVNRIVAQYRRTGLREHVNARPPQFLDLAEIPDFQTAMNTVVGAQQLFDQLPAKVRASFDNSPAKLLDAAEAAKTDVDVYRMLQKIGVLPPPEPKAEPELEPAPAVE